MTERKVTSITVKFVRIIMEIDESQFIHYTAINKNV